MVTGRIAIIPARGGSKRIPRKNIVEFMGKPMISRTIEAALESGCFDHVLVSTDDQEIASVAVEFGAEVPFLRVENADDQSSSSAATISALRQAEAHWGEGFRVVAQLMPNCPLRGWRDIREAVERFDQSGGSFQVSCVEFGWMNPWWAARIDADGRPDALFPEQLAMRSQDLPPLYCPTGAIWLAEASLLAATGTFYGPGCRYFPLSWAAGIDIDDADDLEMAEAVALLRAGKATRA